MNPTIKVLGAIVGVALLAGAAFGGVSLVRAQTGTPTPGTQTKSSILADAEAKLAANLGVSTDQLNQALKTTADQLIDEAVANGKLTQSQADALKQKVDSAQDPFAALFMLRGRGLQMRQQLGQREVLKAAAATLNMQPADLLTALQANGGQSLADVAQAHNMSVDDLKSGIISHATDDINAAVSSGKLTQQQADTAIQNLKNNIDTIVNKKFTGHAGMGRGWHMGPKGGMPGNGNGNGNGTPGSGAGFFGRYQFPAGGL